MPEKRKVQSQEVKKETLVYLGPEIPGVAAVGTVFKNGLTKKLEEMTRELPAVKMLLVPVRNVVRTKKELEKESSVVKTCYQRVAEYAAQKQKGV